MSDRLLALAAAAVLVVMTGGGGGSDPRAAAAWMIPAVLLLAATLLRDGKDGALRAPAIAAGLAALVVLLSALQADRAEASLEQAAAWILAVAPAVTILSAVRRLGGEAPSWARRVVLAASCAVLLVQAAGALGWPLLGRAGGVQPGRLLGTFFDPNHLAALLVVVAAMNAPWAGRAGPARLHLALSVLAGSGALATRSRIAVLAVGVILVAEAWRRRREAGRPLPPAAKAAIVAGVLAVVAAGGAVAWSRRGDPDAWTRPAIWRGAAPAMLERPLLGLGPAGFHSEWPRFQRPVERGLSFGAKIATTPHGEWLRLPIEIGALGLLALAALGTAIARAARGALGPLLTPLTAVLPILLVHDAFHSRAFVGWLALAIAVPLAAVPRRDRPSVRSPGWDAGVLLVAAGTAAAVVRMNASQFLLERSLATNDPAALRRSLALAPNDVVALLHASDLAGAAPGDGALESLSLADMAARLAPRDARAAREQARSSARMMLSSGSLPARPAREAYERAAALAPFDAGVRVEAAGVLVRAGEPAAGLAFARDALRLEPHLARARALAIVAYEQLGDQDSASADRESLRRDLARDPSGLTPAERGLLEIEPELAARAGLR